MDEAERAATVATLERPATRPAVVFLDTYLERLSPRIPDLVREHYVRAGPRNVFVRRDAAPLCEGERAS
jgi:hypothetical protein